MGADSWDDVKVTGRSTAHTRLTFAAQANPFPGLGARRNVDADGFCS
jgi:hypothetical protein